MITITTIIIFISYVTRYVLSAVIGVNFFVRRVIANGHRLTECPCLKFLTLSAIFLQLLSLIIIIYNLVVVGSVQI